MRSIDEKGKETNVMMAAFGLARAIKRRPPRMEHALHPAAEHTLMVIAENDPTGESGVVKEAYQYLKEELHNEKMKCTIYSDEEMASYGLYGGQLHWCWIPTLNNKEISDWLFAQKKE